TFSTTRKLISSDTGQAYFDPGYVEARTPLAAAGTNVYVTWVDNLTGHIYFNRSTDSGANFLLTPKDISTDLALPSGTAHFPQVAAAGNRVYLAWELDGTYPASTIYLAESIDYGSTFKKIMDSSPYGNQATAPQIAIAPTCSNNTTKIYSDMNVY